MRNQSRSLGILLILLVFWGVRYVMFHHYGTFTTMINKPAIPYRISHTRFITAVNRVDAIVEPTFARAELIASLQEVGSHYDCKQSIPINTGCVILTKRRYEVVRVLQQVVPCGGKKLDCAFLDPLPEQRYLTVQV